MNERVRCERPRIDAALHALDETIDEGELSPQASFRFAGPTAL